MTPYERIMKWCDDNDETPTSLAKRAGIEESMIRQLGRGPTKRGRQRTLSKPTAMRLAAVMGVPPELLGPPPGAKLYGRAAQKVKAIPLPRKMQTEDDIAEMLRQVLENQRKLLAAIDVKPTEKPATGRRTIRR